MRDTWADGYQGPCADSRIADVACDSDELMPTDAFFKLSSSST